MSLPNFPAAQQRTIGVLLVEDSRVIRDFLVFVLESDPAIQVIDAVADGEAALVSVKKRRPDVILMDIHLPGMDGFEATRRIMSTDPVPIIICTASASVHEMHIAMKSLESGALAVIKKPKGIGDPDAEADAAEMIKTVRLMSEVRVVRRWTRTAVASPPVAAAPVPGPFGNDATIVAIGASTGGPPVIAQILAGLSPSFPAPILVVQHIAVGFTIGFAEWLAATARLPVHVARHGETPLPGHVYIAPDDQHLAIGPRGELQTTRDEPYNGLRPSVGVLFRSVAERFGRRAVGVLLTGMGRDGAEELKLMADRGALTVAQDEETCVVFGMPGEAIQLGAARFVFPPHKIAELLNSAVRRGENGGGNHGQ